MKEKIISALRVFLATLVASLVMFLTSKFAFEITPEFQTVLDTLVSSLSIAVGTGVYYLIARLLEKYAPRLLLFLTPDTKPKEEENV